MTNSVENHEKSQKMSAHEKSVNDILDNVENVPFALSGAQSKTVLYIIFSLIAFVELAAALGFYGTSLGATASVAFTITAILSGFYHYFQHSILSITAKGYVFQKKTASDAMNIDVKVNIALSLVLLIMSSCTVFFVGKKGFTAYRAIEFEKKMKPTTPSDTHAITPEMLTSKSGKISVYKLELLGKAENAKATATEATTAAAAAERATYDASTHTITDIVGASAFVLEFLLALLSLTIATAKKAAVMEEITRRGDKYKPIMPIDIMPIDIAKIKAEIQAESEQKILDIREQAKAKILELHEAHIKIKDEKDNLLRYLDNSVERFRASEAEQDKLKEQAKAAESKYEELKNAIPKAEAEAAEKIKMIESQRAAEAAEAAERIKAVELQIATMLLAEPPKATLPENKVIIPSNKNVLENRTQIGYTNPCTNLYNPNEPIIFEVYGNVQAKKDKPVVEHKNNDGTIVFYCRDRIKSRINQYSKIHSERGREMTKYWKEKMQELDAIEASNLVTA